MLLTDSDAVDLDLARAIHAIDLREDHLGVRQASRRGLPIGEQVEYVISMS